MRIQFSIYRLSPDNGLGVVWGSQEDGLRVGRREQLTRRLLPEPSEGPSVRLSPRWWRACVTALQGSWGLATRVQTADRALGCWEVKEEQGSYTVLG